MIKYVCDYCGRAAFNYHVIKAGKDELTFDARTNDLTNRQRHICKHCLIKALQEDCPK